MQTKILKSFWGMTEGATLDDKCRIVAQAGYDGIETEPPDMPPAAWRELLDRHNLVYVSQIFSFTADEFARNYRHAAKFGPLLINSHTGRDKMTFAEGRACFETALALEREVSVPVAHETHRHRLLYNPWTTAAYLEALPDLKISADFSHWTCVCESTLMDMDEWVELACSRALHVHARVGYEEGPQVPDPRAPEYRRYVDCFDGWWDRIRGHRQQSGAATMTLTPEYGPPGYMHTLPHTNVPVADLWQICLWSADHHRQRWRLAKPGETEPRT